MNSAPECEISCVRQQSTKQLSAAASSQALGQERSPVVQSDLPDHHHHEALLGEIFLFALMS